MTNFPTSSSGSYGTNDRKILVPILSILVVLVASLFFGVAYRYIEELTTLLFFAVLVRMMTEFGPSEIGGWGRDGEFLMFLAVALHAVTVGVVIRYGVTGLTGDIYAIQSLALIALLSRWYVNGKTSSSVTLLSILQYRDPIDRYLFLLPCFLAFFLPVVQQILAFQLIQVDTVTGFVHTIFLSVFSGIVAYYYENR